MGHQHDEESETGHALHEAAHGAGEVPAHWIDDWFRRTRLDGDGRRPSPTMAWWEAEPPAATGLRHGPSGRSGPVGHGSIVAALTDPVSLTVESTSAATGATAPHDPDVSRTGGLTQLRRGAVLGLVAVLAAAAGAFGYRIGAGDRELTVPVTPRSGESAGGRTVVVGAGIDVTALYERSSASIVQIAVDGNAGAGVGSGIVVSTSGEILTNAHVLGGYDRARVRLPGESQGRSATVVAVDEGHDLALLTIDDTVTLVPAEFAGGAAVVGEEVVAIGYALGFSGAPTVTRGIVSARQRSLGPLSGLLQTDAAISPGNSGGPLLDGEGRVLGVTTAKVTAEAGADNVGFAIPADTVVRFLSEARGGEVVEGGFLGVMLTTGEPGDLGALVTDVVAGSAADDGGMRTGDVIVAVDGDLVLDPGDLGSKLRIIEPGTAVTVTVRRDGVESDLAIVVRARS